MKNTFSLIAFTLVMGAFTVSYGQELDPRLLKNRGDQAQTAFKYNMNGYRYFLFELDSAYQVVSLLSLSKDEKKMLRKDIVFSAEQIKSLGTSSFNYYDLGIRLSSKSRQYIQVDRSTVLVMLAITEVTKAFSESPLNTK